MTQQEKVKVKGRAAVTMALGSLLGSPLLGLLNGLVVMAYWNWYAHHIWLKAPKMSYPVAVGVVILISCLFSRRYYSLLNLPKMVDIPDKFGLPSSEQPPTWKYMELTERMAEAIREWIKSNTQTAIGLLVFGWVLHQFV